MHENPNRSPTRRFFSFTIRELLLLTLIVALAVGWWRGHRKSIPPATPPPQVGRWQFFTNGDKDDLLVDTATGECWYFNEWNNEWKKRPALPKK